MTSWIFEAGSFLVKYAGKALGGPAELARVIGVATLSTSESILKLIGSGLASDIGQWKTAMLDERKARAALKVAKAAEAANRVARGKRRNAIEAAEARIKIAKLRAK